MPIVKETARVIDAFCDLVFYQLSVIVKEISDINKHLQKKKNNTTWVKQIDRHRHKSAHIRELPRKFIYKYNIKLYNAQYSQIIKRDNSSTIHLQG